MLRQYSIIILVFLLALSSTLPAQSRNGSAAQQGEDEKQRDIAFGTFVVGAVHEFQGNWHNAVVAYTSALRFDNDVAIHDAIVRCAMEMDDHVLAMRHMRIALALAGDSVRRTRLLAEAYLASGVADSALQLFEQVLTVEQDEEVLYKAAGLHMKRGAFMRAAALYDSLRLRFPGKPAYSLLLSEAYMNAGNWSAASDILYPLAGDSAVGHEDRMQIGKLFFQKALEEHLDVERAIEVFDTLHEDFPDDWRILWFRGAVLFNEGATDDAISSFEEVLRLAPDNRQAAAILGRALISRERYTQAADLLQDVVTDGRADAEIYALLGHVYSVLGDQPRAREALQEALRLDPTNDALRSTLDAMQQPE